MFKFERCLQRRSTEKQCRDVALLRPLEYISVEMVFRSLHFSIAENNFA